GVQTCALPISHTHTHNPTHKHTPTQAQWDLSVRRCLETSFKGVWVKGMSEYWACESPQRDILNRPKRKTPLPHTSTHTHTHRERMGYGQITYISCVWTAHHRCRREREREGERERERERGRRCRSML